MGTETQFTPGPWEAQKYDGYSDEIQITAVNGVYVASIDVDGQREGQAWPEIESCAHLIAAAPDMYEALELILPLARGYAARNKVGNNSALITTAEQALAKARGEA